MRRSIAISIALFSIGSAAPIILDSPAAQRRLLERKACEIRVVGCGINAYFQLPANHTILSDFLENFWLPESAISVQVQPAPPRSDTTHIKLNGKNIRDGAWYDPQLCPGDIIWILDENGQS